MGFRQEALRHKPAYRPTQEGGLPSLPNRPRTPHIPHARALALGAALTLAGTAAALSLEKASQSLAQTHVDPRTNLVPAEQMRYPWDSGNVHLDLQYTEVGENIFELSGVEMTNEPKTMNIGDGKYVQFVLGEEYGELDDPYGHVTLNLMNDVMKGGIWEKSVDAEGNPILDADGKPIIHEFGYVEPEPNKEGLA